jgi:hypothetical protein
MSEFDTAGFSAIDRFFGGDDDDAKNSNNKSAAASSTKLGSQHPKGKRRGVGSAAAPAANETQSDWTKKVLKVGRKKRGRIEDDDDGSDDDAEKKAHDSNDEEEETGRTGIAPKEAAKRADAGTLVNDEEKPKKKLGKKERKKQQEEEQAREALKEKEQGDDSETGKDTKEIMLVDGEANARQKTKSKRRKIRSRQKNIYKDNRETKPDHLVVGNRKKYQGRPLTTETRTKLNLPPPKVRAPHLVEESTRDDDMLVEGTGLAIDDLLEDSGKRVESSSTLVKQGKKKEKVNKKPKKSKYKNLK